MTMHHETPQYWASLLTDTGAGDVITILNKRTLAFSRITHNTAHNWTQVLYGRNNGNDALAALETAAQEGCATPHLVSTESELRRLVRNATGAPFTGGALACNPARRERINHDDHRPSHL
jgi:hypothetical protein